MVKEIAVMAIAQFAQFVVLTVNFRAIAHARYAEAGLSAAVASLLGYVITRKVAGANSHWGLVGLVIGGAAADMSGIWLTRAWQ